MVVIGVVATSPAFAQTPSTNSTPVIVPAPVGSVPQVPSRPPDVQPFITQRPVVIPRPGAPDPLSAHGRPERPRLPDNVKALVDKFQQDREGFLDQQKQLAKQLKEATDEQRAAIRDQMRENLEKWREAQKELRAELQNRIAEMKSELQDRGRVIGSAKDGSRP